MPAPLRPLDARSLLERCAPLAELPPAAADALVRRMRERSWHEGETMIREGEPGDWLALVAVGTTRVEVRDAAGAFRTVAKIGPAELVGEMAILTRRPRLADVVAETDVTAFVLPAADFDEIAAEHPELGVVLTRLVADRLGRTDADGLSGKEVDRYRIVRCVGRGATAAVYEAVDGADGARVALKMMSHGLVHERGALARFRREAELLAAVRHPNVARVHRAFAAFRTHFLAMEFCDGPTLARVVVERGPFGEAETRRVAAQLASALDCLHSRGIVHRDVKPSNVLVAADGTVRLADFGLAKPADRGGAAGVTEARTLVGTPRYMSPEALLGDEPGAAGDVYALGCVLLELLLGRCPFDAASFAGLVEAKTGFRLPPAPALGIGPETHAVLAQALAADPAQRSVDLAAVARWE